MIPGAVLVSGLAGVISGAAVGLLVTWETLGLIIRHSPYRGHDVGHLWSK